ncbi:MAG: phosphate ABC transporter permease subunit PstC [Planctomycetes bacterium]|nr:phosphate ABC transporter permease subunit PstC [Planctomycetota bacterium]
MDQAISTVNPMADTTIEFEAAPDVLIDLDRSEQGDLRTEEMLINMGPQHPSTHGVLRIVLRTDGEMVLEAIPHIGYLHRCAEKIGENLPPYQYIPYTDRMDYLAGMNNNVAFSMTVELLAGIPSIIYGIWGLFVLAPFLQQYVQPAVIDAFDGIPILSTLFAGPPFGIGIFTAGLILAIMILPFISSITRDVFEAVPPVLKEAAYGLGATVWEVMWYVVLPYARVGVVGGVMLALGRALGETMAITFVIGNAHRVSASLFAPGTSISAAIANEFTEAVGDLYYSSLIALGLILFLVTFIVLAAAQYMLMRIERRAGGGTK